MPRYVVATINDQHNQDVPVVWRDGERHVFLHGAEFEASEIDAHTTFDKLKNIGRTTLQVTSNTQYFPEYDLGLSTVTSAVEQRLNAVLGRLHDEHNSSVYVTKNQLAKFEIGDLFVVGELVLAEVVVGGTLVERSRLRLRGSDNQERHAIDEFMAV